MPDAEGYVEAEAMEVGTVETEPLSASALALGFSVGLWRLLPTIQHPIMQRPATATPLLQPYPPLGTGVIPTSNITHMCPIAQLHGGRKPAASALVEPDNDQAWPWQLARRPDSSNRGGASR